MLVSSVGTAILLYPFIWLAGAVAATSLLYLVDWFVDPMSMYRVHGLPIAALVIGMLAIDVGVLLAGATVVPVPGAAAGVPYSIGGMLFFLVVLFTDWTTVHKVVSERVGIGG